MDKGQQNLCWKKMCPYTEKTYKSNSSHICKITDWAAVEIFCKTVVPGITGSDWQASSNDCVLILMKF
jgi:hypothetical protein